MPHSVLGDQTGPAYETLAAQALECRAVDRQYALVHLVSQEIGKALIETQVIDHMEVQATAPGDHAPSRVAVMFVEAFRAVMRPRTIVRRRTLARRAPHVEVWLGPYVGRLGLRRNAGMLAVMVRRFARGMPTVLHCRGESAALWALAMRPHLRGAGIVVDVRGIWPEEFLLTRGYDSVDSAAGDRSAMAGYRDALARIREALRGADAMLAVSDPLVAWVDRHVDQRPAAHVVPCCVSSVVHDERARRTIRSRLGVENKTVLCYVGTVARYQSIEDGFAQFCAIAVGSRGADRIHALCLTPDTDRARQILVSAGIPEKATTVIGVPQASVPEYLAAADAGFLLRDDTDINRVSVPVKLGEYLGAGVPVVISSVLEWNTHLLRDSPAALAIDWFGVSEARRVQQVDGVLERLSRDPASLRAEALSLAGSRFTWDAYVPRVRDAYCSALHASSASTAP